MPPVPAYAAGGGAAPAPSANPLLAQARLSGRFRLRGRITTARGVTGEHVGERFTRDWGFVSSCPTGPCNTVALSRGRFRGTDAVALHRNGAGSYSGQGSFFAPLRCGRLTVQRGERVPFTIRVTITAASTVAYGVVATSISASYSSARRINLTSCLVLPAREAASYQESVVPGR